MKIGNGSKKRVNWPKKKRKQTQKKEEPDQNENLKLFLKTGNWPIKWGNGSKILRYPSKRPV